PTGLAVYLCRQRRAIRPRVVSGSAVSPPTPAAGAGHPARDDGPADGAANDDHARGCRDADAGVDPARRASAPHTRRLATNGLHREFTRGRPDELVGSQSRVCGGDDPGRRIRRDCSPGPRDLSLRAQLAGASRQPGPARVGVECRPGRARTSRRTPVRHPAVHIAPPRGKLGVLLVGLGAVSTTLIAGVYAIRKGLAAPVGSLTQLGTIRLGKRTEHRSPAIRDFVPLAGLEDLVFGAWDIFEDNAYA